MRAHTIILLAIVGIVSAQSGCDGGDSADDSELATCIFAEIDTTECSDQACICTQGASVTSCYSRYCGGYVPTAIAASQSSACANPGGYSQLSPITYFGSNPTATFTSAPINSTSTVSVPAATSLIPKNLNTTSSITVAPTATLPSTATTAPTSVEPPSNTVRDPPTHTASGAAQPAAASKAAANLAFITPAGGILAAALGLLAYL